MDWGAIQTAVMIAGAILTGGGTIWTVSKKMERAAGIQDTKLAVIVEKLSEGDRRMDRHSEKLSVIAEEQVQMKVQLAQFRPRHGT